MCLSLPLSCIVAYSCAYHYHYHVLLHIHVPVITIIMYCCIFMCLSLLLSCIFMHLSLLSSCIFMCLSLPLSCIIVRSCAVSPNTTIMYLIYRCVDTRNSHEDKLGHPSAEQAAEEHDEQETHQGCQICCCQFCCLEFILFLFPFFYLCFLTRFVVQMKDHWWGAAHFKTTFCKTFLLLFLLLFSCKWTLKQGLPLF